MSASISWQEEAHTRRRAINPTESFIIQAPAGSGKTHLLIQRYLSLLITVEQPEEIIAVTFTRKAAYEMRDRVLSALGIQADQQKPSAQASYSDEGTVALVQQVQWRDQQQNWQLIHNPHRLRILTIDALAHLICSYSPILSQSASIRITEESHLFYQKAAEQIVLDPHYARSIKILLMHLDNKADKLKQLLADMLACREQWLPQFIAHRRDPDALKQPLENGIAEMVVQTMKQLIACLPDAIRSRLMPLIKFASTRIYDIDKTHHLVQWQSRYTLPEADITHLNLWKSLACLLLTAQGEWRKTVNKKCGFPSPTSTQDPEQQQQYTEKKQAMLALLDACRKHEALRLALSDILSCPPPYYNDNQWLVLCALLDILPIATAQLNLLFQESRHIDFSGLTLHALRVLGQDDTPSDLALRLDHKIKHLLIDEFQDTSTVHFAFIERLISGWETQDGRTLFIVGDPMQSIYRFRQTEVSLFLQVQEDGIAHIHPTPLALRYNFRSKNNLVNWINTTFSTLFPEKANRSLGAIPYFPSTTQDTTSSQGCVCFYQLDDPKPDACAQQVIDIIRRCHARDPSHSLALLVRSRSELTSLLPSLRQAHITVQAVEIEKLIQSPVILDLLSLTQALHHIGDRLSWLAIFRSPMMGLSLYDLHALSEYAGTQPLVSSLAASEHILGLSEGGRQRIQRLWPLLQHALHERDTHPLSSWIEGTWIALGGPVTLSDASMLDDATAYFRLLDTMEGPFDPHVLKTKLHHLYRHSATPSPLNTPEQPCIQVMTIHKAKGLEFDTVILPSLHHRTGHDKSRLLLYLEQPHASKQTAHIVLAPIQSSTETTDPLYHYLNHIEKKKSALEQVRCLYVAATRAKSSLHLITYIEVTPEAADPWVLPAPHSFARLLWPILREQLDMPPRDASSHRCDPHRLSPEQRSEHNTPPMLEAHLIPNYRLSSDSYPAFHIQPPKNRSHTTLCSMGDAQAQIGQPYLGIVIHEALQQIAQQPEIWTQEKILTHSPYWKTRLYQLGMPSAQLNTSKAIIIEAISRTLNDPQGRWILSAEHHEAENEYALTSTALTGQPQHYIIDRTFIDRCGVRWIIDYKTTYPLHHQQINEFIQQQYHQHKQQLENYATILAHIEGRPMQLGLYFPLCSAWKAWHGAQGIPIPLQDAKHALEVTHRDGDP